MPLNVSFRLSSSRLSYTEDAGTPASGRLTPPSAASQGRSLLRARQRPFLVLALKSACFWGRGCGILLPLSFGAVAQLVEHHVRNVGVRGSNPLRSTIRKIRFGSHAEVPFS